jgi:hypothetical protein
MGGGYLSTFLGTRPAAGGEISETVPTGARWELLCVNTTCDCFTPGNRQAYLQLRDIIPGFTMFEAPNPLIVNAAQARWEWGSSVPAPYPGDPFVGVGSLPSPMALTAGQSFGTRTLFIQPADQYGPPIFTVREWLEAQ